MLSATLGFFVLAAMTATLMTHALAQASRLTPLWGAPMILVLAAFLFQCRNEWTRIFHAARPAASSRETPALTVLAIVTGALTTFILANAVGLGPVVAASLVGASGALISRNKAAAVYCGSFVGMVSQDCLYASTHVVLAALLAGAVFLLAALITGLIFIFTLPAMGGAGGKLGAIAFASSLAAKSLADRATRRSKDE